MKNFLKKSNLILLAFLLAVGTASASNLAKKSFANKKWAYNPSAPAGSRWSDVTALQQSTEDETRDYSCSQNTEQTCTAEFLSTVDPNSNPSAIPSNVINGDFALE